MGKWVLSSKYKASKQSFGTQSQCHVVNCVLSVGCGDHAGHAGKQGPECLLGVFKGWEFSYSTEQWNNLITQRPLETAEWLLSNNNDNKIATIY